jgi:two-component system response regulator PilR (NtrC family)
MVKAQEFREDLYYRINVIELGVPALRDRGDDVLMLADYIMDKLGADVRLDDAARAELLKYRFPGNVRELENMLERAVTLCSSGVVCAADLNVRSDQAARAPAGTAHVGDLGEQVDDVQRQAIVEALEKTRYNKTQAAKLLGLTFRQLRYRIQKLGIDA